MRTTIEKVRVIIETDLLDASITSFIEGANLFVTEALGEVSSETVMTEIERWIAAHMISVSQERQAESEEAGGAKIKYTGTYFEGLRSTSYGQMAINIDISGTLAEIADKKKKIKLMSLGKGWE